VASIQERPTASGKIVYRVAYRLDGKQISRTVTTERDAKRLDKDIKLRGAKLATDAHDERILDQADDDPELTVSDWMTRHIESLSGVQEGTRSDYRAYQRRDVDPTIGELPLEALTRERIGAWVNDLAGRGLSGKSIKNRHSLLSAALTSAVRAGHIPTNHAKGTRLPRTDHHRVEMVILDGDERDDLIDCVEERYQPLVATLMLTGMRWGEATALTVAHLDLERGKIRVRQSWKHADGRTPELGPPKSRRGIRDISIDDMAVAILRRQVAGKQAWDWVFSAPRGGPLRHNTFYDGTWVPAVSLFAGDYTDVETRQRVRGRGKRPRIHDLRHTYASTLIADRWSLMYVQYQLGHESIQTTSDTYGHMQSTAHEEMKVGLSMAFRGLKIGVKALSAAPSRPALEA